MPTQNLERRTYPDWAVARFDAGQDHADLAAFVAHLKPLGADYRDPARYGWPCAPRAGDPPPAAIVTRFGPPPPVVADAIRRAFPPDLWVAAAEIAREESGWDPAAVADTTRPGRPCGTVLEVRGGVAITAEKSVGLFQINVCAHGEGDWADPFANARKARELYEARGNWGAWFFSAGVLGLPR